jgi:FixJ family two-component response regulator
MIYLINSDISTRCRFEVFLKSAEIDNKSFENGKDLLTGVKPGKKKTFLFPDLLSPEINRYILLNKRI